eukprot:6457977-Amphidinium_carterae.1
MVWPLTACNHNRTLTNKVGNETTSVMTNPLRMVLTSGMPEPHAARAYLTTFRNVSNIRKQCVVLGEEVRRLGEGMGASLT